MGEPQRKRERKKKGENFPEKGSNLTHSLAHSQNKGLGKYQRRASQLYTDPSPHLRGREARAGRQGAAVISVPEMASSTKLSRLPVANYIFLRSWIIDIRQEGHSLRSAPQRRHTAHLRQCSHGESGKLSGQMQEVIKTYHAPRTVRLPRTWSPELLRPGKGTKCTPSLVCALAEYPRPEQLRPGKCRKCMVRFRQCPCRAPWSLSSVDPGSTYRLELWQTCCGPCTVSTPHTHQ